MSKTEILPTVWLTSNIVFITLYSLYILTKTRLPIPSFVYTLTLLTTYIASLYKYVADGKISIDANFYSLILLLTFPRPFFLAPYFFSAIYNAGGFIGARKKQFGGTVLYHLAQMIVARQRALLTLVYLVQLLMLPVLLVAILFGLSNVFSLLAYWKVVSYEVYSNPEMRRCVAILLNAIDDNAVWFPPIVQEKYAILKEMIMKRIGIEKVEKNGKKKKE